MNVIEQQLSNIHEIFFKCQPSSQKLKVATKPNLAPPCRVYFTMIQIFIDIRIHFGFVKRFAGFVMMYQKDNLDVVLVPSALIVMFGYHLWLLYRCLNCPHTTIIGFENNDKRAWVGKIMQMEKNDLSIPLSVLSYNISAAMVLSSICLTLCAIMGAWVANSSSMFQSKLIYGNTSSSTISIKHICLLLCFLLAFACFVESTRSLIHATYLISIPDSNVPTKSVEMAVIRGGDFWSLGLRVLYLALTLLVWFFGPIPMFATSVTIVCVLYFLDNNTEPLHLHYTSKKSIGLSPIGPTSSPSVVGVRTDLQNVV